MSYIVNVLWMVAGAIMVLMCFCSYKILATNSLLTLHNKTLKIIFSLILISDFIFLAGIRAQWFNGIIYQICIFCLGATFMIFCFLMPTWFASKGIDKFSKHRREFIKLMFDISVILGLFTYLLRGIYNGLNVIITTRTVELKGLKESLNIAVISDIHISDILKEDFILEISRKIQNLNPDAIFIVGDITDLNPRNIGTILDPLSKIKTKYGIFLVVGNHEYYHGIDELITKFKSLNFRVLENESVSFGGINLAGVYDLHGFKVNKFKPDFQKALANIDDAKPTVLLSHQPKSIQYLTQEVDLMICGHTHAGQIFPLSLFVWLDQKYIYGLYTISEKMKLLVSSGVGFWGPPMRILSNSEIVNLKLLPRS